jgi:alpha-tubulin suppressor-like RCC1 family protein
MSKRISKTTIKSATEEVIDVTVNSVDSAIETPKKKRSYKTTRKPHMLALEPRMLFDGAAVAAAVDVAQDSQAPDIFSSDINASSSSFAANTESSTSATDTPTEIDPNYISSSLSGAVDTRLALATPAPNNRNELVVVDGSLSNLQILIDDIARIDPDRTILVLDPSINEATQLSNYLEQHTASFDAIHVLSHGGEGWISLGDQTLQLSTPEQNAQFWDAIKNSLTDSGDVLLYGCNVANNAAGQTIITELANYTAADIAASSDITGQTGDWVLETTSGSIETTSITAAEWQGDLGLYDARPVIANITVNEGDGTNYALFVVKGNTGASVTLALAAGTVSTGVTVATAGTDYVNSMEYWNGTAWINYTAATVILPNDELLVRVQILKDADAVSTDTFKLTATYTAATGGTGAVNGGASIAAIATIVENGTGKNFTSIPPISVNENSPYAVFSIDKAYDQQVKLALGVTNFILSNATDNATIGSDSAVNDVNTTLQYWNGGVWVDYVAGSIVTAPKGVAFLVRVAINDQVAYEGPETFTLKVSDASDVTLGYGVATIMDNGTGSIFTGDATVSDASAAYAAATTEAEKAATLELWRQANETKSNIIIAGNQGAFYKADDGNYYVTGANASPTGTNQTTPTLLTTANGYNYTGTIIDVAVAGRSADQYFLLTTTGLYAWGSEDTGLNTSLTTNTSFQRINTPGDFILADVKSMTASYLGVMFLMKDGTVRSVTNSTAYPSGHPATGDFTRVVDASGNILTGITHLELSAGSSFTTAAFAYSASTNKFYTWGTTTYLGNGTASSSRTQATEMTNPLPAGVQAVQIGASYNTYYVLGSDGRVYVTGLNASGSAGQNATGAVAAWTTMRNTSGTTSTSLENVQFFSAQSSAENNNGNDAIQLILDDGSVLAVGSGGLRNKLGTTTTGNITKPTLVAGTLANKVVYTVEVGGYFSAAMMHGTADKVSYSGEPAGAVGTTTTTVATFAETTIAGIADAPVASITLLNPTVSDLRDDTGIAVNDIIVKEAASTYAVFVLEISNAQQIKMALAAGTAGAGTDYTDTSTSMAYWSGSGSTWTTYTPSALLSVTAGQRLHVRVPILVTTGTETNETFTLNISDAEGSFMKLATATIVEDSTGTTYAATATNVTVDNVTVNEASPYAVFKITGVANQKVTLSLAGGTASASEYGSALEYYNGTAWVSYTANSFAAIPNASTTLLVRTSITNDNILDDGETFRLIAANEAGVTAIGIATIKDDGTGNLFSIANNTGNTDSPTGVGDLPASIDNDQNRPLSINSIAVNERSSYSVFTVSGAANQVISSLALIAGTSNSATGSGTDYGTGTGTGLEYWNGTTWTSYSTGSISIDATGVLLVRTPIVNDSTVDNNETFRLSAEAANGQTATGTATIKDDGTGTIFVTTTSTNGVTAATPSTPVTAQTVTSPTTSIVLAANAADLPNEDRLLSVTSVTVNEASPYAIFKVTGATDKYTRLSLASVTATVGTDTDTALQYYDGAAWQNYTTNSFVKIASTGLLVRVAIKNDTGAAVGDPGETFKLIAQNTNGTSNSVGGIATIMDDGTGGWFAITNSTGEYDTPGTLDKDFGITSVIVNEGSPYVVFSVVGGNSGASSYTGLNSITITAGTATSADYGTAVQYWNGTAWTAFVVNMSISNKTLMRFAITNDILNEGSENFTVVISSGNGATATGTFTIKDDGTGTLFTSDNPSGGVPATATMPTPVNGVVAAASAALLPNDDRPLSVNTFTVNEGSPYAVFIVTGVTGQFVKLATSNGTATSADYGPGLEFYDGAAWQTYTANGFVQIPAGTSGTGTTLLVRTAIVNEAAWDRDETFNLIASTTGNINTTGVATISDSAAGGLFSINNTTGTPDTIGSQNDLPIALDDDRNQPLSTSDISVNEGSPFAVFKFMGTPSKAVTSLTFNGGSADTAAGSGGDYGSLSTSGIEWWNGSQWISHDVTTATTDSNGVLLLRVAITNDTNADNNETFSLTVVDRTYSATATATIKDDGSGTLFTAGSPTGSNATITTPPTPVAGVVLAASASNLPNDDRALSVNSFSINEGSPQAVFTVTGATGQFVKLALASGTATVGTDTGSTLQYLSGSTWTNYTADSFVQMASTTLLVRTTITNDSFADDDETFTLTATNTGTSSAVGTATIKDDGTGILFGGNNITGIADAPGVNGAPATLNNDQTLVINPITVNEGSSHAVFTITGGSNKQVSNLVLSAGASIPATGGGVDYGASSGDSLEYWNAGTSLWVAYTSGNLTLDSNGRLFVRTAIINDSSSDNNETFNLAATNSLGTTTTAIATIKDDGTGTLFTSGSPVGTAPATLTAPTPVSSVVTAANSANILNDDRAISVSSITVNEGSQRAIFSVTASAGMMVRLSVADGTATGAISGGDYNPSLQYLIGSTWNNYTAGDYVQTPVSGTLLVRVAITNDSSDEPATGETFTLTVTNSGGINATGTATIFDNGKGSLFSTTNTTGSPDTLAANGLTALDDDRSIKISIADVAVNEGSSYAILTLEGVPSDSFKLALGNTSSTADIDASLTADIGSLIQYYNGAGWVNYVADSFIQFPVSSGLLLVRVGIVNDSALDNNETFTLIASNNTTASISATVTIKDDGTGTLFIAGNPGSSNNNGVITYFIIAGGTLNDDRSLVGVSSVNVNEASPFAIFTVTGVAGQSMSLAATAGTGSTSDFGAISYFDGSTWISYTAGSFVSIPLTGSTLLVRVAITNDRIFEASETFNLVATTSGGSFVSGLGTIKDDGTGDLFSSTNTTGTADAVGTVDAKGTTTTADDVTLTLNDDRMVSIGSILVNEGSPYAVFNIIGGNGTQVKLTLDALGSTVIGANNNGTNDINNVIQYWTGTSWIDVGASGLVTIPNTTNLFARVALYNQTAFEGPQSFNLIVTDTSDVVRGTGLATIMDDGTGNIFTGNTTITDPSAAFASATTDAEKLTALDAWRAANFEKSRWIISGFHGSFYKADGGGYYVSGEFASPTAGDLSTPLLVSSANGYVYNGTIIDVAVPSTQNDQFLMVTTQGLYAWGFTNIGLSSTLTTGSAFQKITTPTDFVAAEVRSMTASNQGVMFVMIDGTVRTVTMSSANSGHPISGDFTKVVDAGGAAITGITDLEYFQGAAFAYSATSGKFYTWGANTFLGDGTAVAARSVATEMTNPLPAGVKAVQIGISDATYFVLGSDGKVYTCGLNPKGAAGQGNTVAIPTWTTMKNPAGTGPLTDVQFFSTQNNAVYPSYGTSAINMILKDGSVLAAGATSRSMLGIPGTTSTGGSATLPTAPAGSIVGKSAFTVETGGHFSSVLLYGCEGVISATGHNPGGAFGDGTTADRTAYVETLFLGALDTACITPIILSNPTVAQLEDHRPDNRALAINSIEVNEGSPYAVFTVTGGASQYVSLNLEPTTNANLNTFVGIDTGTVLEYFNGTSWVVYEPGSFVRIPSSGTTMLVRVGITNDDFADNAETFNLVASNTDGGAVTGLGTILDNGTGTIFNADGSANTAAVKNDDTGLTQSLTINNLTVNEGSPYAVFTLTGPPNLALSNLALSDTTNPTLNATGAGGVDYGTSLEYWNGTAWTTYNTGDTVNIGDKGLLFVRTAIAPDTTSDNAETFNLTATPAAGSGLTAVTGVATILDDGSGTLFTSANPTSIAPITVTPPSSNVVSSANASTLQNDDRPLTITPVTVNEGSPYAVFNVTGVTGQYTSLSLASDTATVGTDTGSTLEYFDGTAWQTYTAGSFVKIPSGGLLVRVAIANDVNREASAGETFNLLATNTGSGIATGVGTIKDDGTGTIYTTANPTGSTPATLTPPTPVNGAVSAANAVNLPNDDRVISVNSLTVNEGSPYAVFTVTGGSGQFVKLATSPGTASALDYGSALQYFDGTTWQNYTLGSYVQIPTNGTTLLVRNAIYNDISSDAGETFNLTATNLVGTAATGIATIMDDGTGDLFSTNNITGTAEIPGENGLPSAKDNELAVTIKDVIVRECSPFVIFTLDGGYGSTVKLSIATVGTTTIGSTNDGANDLNNKLQYWDAVANSGAGAWIDYDNSVGVSIPAANDLLVRLALYDQVAYEGPESVRLTVTGAGDVVRGTGLATIRDDGNGDVFTGYVTSIDASAAYAAALLDSNATTAQKQAALDAWRQINFEKSRLITSGFHGAFYKADGVGYYVSGENSSPTGDALVTPVLVTPGNGYNYTGSIIDVAIASSRDQYLLLTTDGLYVWGRMNIGLATSSMDFQKVSTPSEFIAANVKAMTASATGVMFLMTDGTVRSMTMSAGNSGHPSTGDFTRVVDATGAPLTGITDLEYSYNTAFAYSASADKFYTWGTRNYLGDGSASVANTVAVEMARPFTVASGVKVVQIGVSENTYFVLGSDGKVYVTGANTFGSAGQNSTTAVLSWTTMRDTTGVAGTSLSDVQFISAQNSTAGSYGGAINMLLKNGSILGTGSNSLSMLGTPITSTDYLVQIYEKVLIPTAPTGTIVGQVAYTVETGGHFSSVLLYGCAGVISATGHNPNGAFGDGSTTDRSAYEEGLFLGNLAEACITPAVVASNTLTGLCDDRPVTVNSLTVNEGSPYVVFKVGGVEGQYVSLALDTGTATSGVDYTAALEYFNGTSWVSYTAGSLVVIPSDGDGTLGEAANLLVRVAITNDDDRDDGETFKLQASNTGGLTVTGTATIKDDGSGNLFSIANNTGDTDSPTGVGDLPASKDNDQSLRVDNLTVNEGSPYAVFTVSGIPGQVISGIALTPSQNANTALNAELGTDSGSTLEYWNGTAWVNYTGSTGDITLGSDGKLLVRTSIVNDAGGDNNETFKLTVTASDSTVVQGTATIKDDGSGTVFVKNDPNTPADESAPTSGIAPTVTAPTANSDGLILASNAASAKMQS